MHCVGSLVVTVLWASCGVLRCPRPSSFAESSRPGAHCTTTTTTLETPRACCSTHSSGAAVAVRGGSLASVFGLLNTGADGLHGLSVNELGQEHF